MTDIAGSMKKRNPSSGWSKLCPELLTRFFASLNCYDQLAFRGVCREWRSVALAAQEYKTSQELILHAEFPDAIENRLVGTKRKSLFTPTFCMRKKRNMGGRWSELCRDLLKKFLSTLNPSDQMAIRNVCKSWRSASSAAQEFKTGKKLISHSEFPDGVIDNDNKQIGRKRKLFTTDTNSMRKKLRSELLTMIHSHIDSMDQLAFRCVCKGRRLAVHTATEDFEEHESLSHSKFSENLLKDEHTVFKSEPTTINAWPMRKTKNVSGEWSELCSDLLIELYAGLDILDQLAFRGVCKGWRSAANAAPEEQKKELWLMYRHVNETIESNYHFVNYSSGERSSYLWSLPNLNGCSILTAKHGWLLMVHSRNPNIQIFFYNPFTRTTITIPPLNRPSWHFGDVSLNRNKSMFDFTAPPTSPECMVYAVFYDVTMNRVFTTSCRQGQAAWAASVEHLGFVFVWMSPKTMVFHGGNFYCICDKKIVGKVLAFHPETNTVKSLSGSPRQVDPGNGETRLQHVLCDTLSPMASYEVVESVGGWNRVVELVRQRERRRRPLREVRVIEGKPPLKTVVDLGEIEIGYPYTYHPFLQKEDGQLLVVYHGNNFYSGDRVWITKSAS